MNARQPSTRRGLLIGVAIGFGGALVLVLVPLLVLGMLSGNLSFASSDHAVPIDGEHVSVEVKVPSDLAIDEVATHPSTADPDCRGVRYEFGGGDLTIEAFASDCAFDAAQQTINGDHGSYRTIEDVPDPVDVEEVSTWAGPAQVFVQHYAEYTNVTSSWDEPVAIVTLDDPVDADFPTVVLRSDKAALSREEFTEIVASLSAIEYQLG